MLIMVFPKLQSSYIIRGFKHLLVYYIVYGVGMPLGFMILMKFLLTKNPWARIQIKIKILYSNVHLQNPWICNAEDKHQSKYTL